MKRRLILLLMLVSAAGAQVSRYDNIAIGTLAGGNVLQALPNASITVTACGSMSTSCTLPANLCSSITDTSCGGSGNLRADSGGNFHFYARAGRYQVVIQASGFQTRTINDVILPISASDGGGVGTNVTVNGTAAVPNSLNFTNTLLPPAGSTVVNFLMNGNTVGAYVTGGGGGGGSLTVNGATGGSDLNDRLPQFPPNGINISWQADGSGHISGAIVGDGIATHCFLGTGVFAACPGGGGGSATLPTTPLYDMFASTGAGAAQASGIKGGSGFLQGQVLTSTGDVNSNPSPFPALPNASVEYFPLGATFGGISVGTTHGLAAYFSHSATTGAAPGYNNGGLMLGGGNSSGTNYQVYVDCESAPLGCDFKVPITINGAGVGGGGTGTLPGALNEVIASNGAGAAQTTSTYANSGFFRASVLESTGTGASSPFNLPNGSIEYFPTGGYGAGGVNGVALHVSHSGTTGYGGIALAGGNNLGTDQLYLDCEGPPVVAALGCDFKVPITYLGNAIGGGGGGSGTVSAGTPNYFAIYTGTTTVSSNPHLDDGQTTPSTITSQETIAAPGINVTGSGGISMTGTGGTLPTPVASSGGIGIGPGNIPEFYSNGGNWTAIGTGGATAGVSSINGGTGAFNFTGAVSCASGTCNFTGGGGGTSVTVNGTAAVPNSLNFNSTAPIGPASQQLITFGLNGNNVSAYFTGTGSATDCLLGTGAFGACPVGSGGGVGAGVVGQVARYNSTSTVAGADSFYSTGSAGPTLPAGGTGGFNIAAGGIPQIAAGNQTGSGWLKLNSVTYIGNTAVSTAGISISNTSPSNIPANSIGILWQVQNQNAANTNARAYLQGSGTATDCLIGTGTFSPCPGGGSSIPALTTGGGLEVSGTNTLGLVTTCTANQYLTWSGTAWQCTPAPTGGGTITGATTNGGLTATGNTLGLLTTCTSGQVLQYNGTQWVCQTPTTGGGSGTVGNGTVGQFALYNGTNSVAGTPNLTDDGTATTTALPISFFPLGPGGLTPTPIPGKTTLSTATNGGLIVSAAGGPFQILRPLAINGAQTGINIGGMPFFNLNNTTPAAPANGINVTWQQSASGSGSAALVGDGSTNCLSGQGTYVPCSGGGASSTVTCQPSADLLTFTARTNVCTLTLPAQASAKQWIVNCNLIWNMQTGGSGTTTITSRLNLSVAPTSMSYWTTETWAGGGPTFGNFNVLAMAGDQTNPLNTTATNNTDLTIWSYVYHGTLMAPAAGMTATISFQSSNGTGAARLGTFCTAIPTS